MRKFVTAVFLLLLLALTSRADPIGPDCETCQGSIYTLESLGNPPELVIGDDGSIGYFPIPDHYLLLLDIDTSGYNAGGSFIDLVGIGASATDASISATSNDRDWYDWGVEVNYDFVYGHGMIPVGGMLDWDLLLTLPSGLTDSYTIKVRYVDD